MNTPTPTPTSTSIRIRLTPDQCADLDRLRSFLGLPSISATAARLVGWNARTIAAALSADENDAEPFASACADAVGDVARLSMRNAVLEALRHE